MRYLLILILCFFSRISLGQPSDFLIEVAKGNVSGHRVINKFGNNPDVDTNTDPEDVWGGGGIYAFFYTTNQTVEAVSTETTDVGTTVSSGTATGGSTTTLIDTSAKFEDDSVAVGDVVINDTTGELGFVTAIDSQTQLTHSTMKNTSSMDPSTTDNTLGHTYRIGRSTGTGVGVFHVEGLAADGNGDWNVQTETVILNGTTDVELNKQFLRLYRAFGVHAGSSDTNDGNLTVDDDSDGTVGIYIVAGDGQTQQSIFTIPSGHKGYFIDYSVGTTNTGSATAGYADFTWQARHNNGASGPWLVKGKIELVTTGSGSYTRKYPIPPGLSPKTDIKINCGEVSRNDMGVVGTISVLLVKDGHSKPVWK